MSNVGLGGCGFAQDLAYAVYLLARLRGGAVWQLVGLITRRSQVRILPPLPGTLQKGPVGAFLLAGWMFTGPWGPFFVGFFWNNRCVKILQKFKG